MAILDKKEAFVKQIGIFLSNKEFEKAYELSKELAGRYNESISHFLIAKSLFWMESYEEMLPEAKKALKLSTGEELESAAIMLAACYYKLGKYSEGKKTLESLGETKNIDAIKMRFMIAAIQGKKREQEGLLKELSEIDQKEAEDFAMSIIMQEHFERIDVVKAIPKKVIPSKQK